MTGPALDPMVADADSGDLARLVRWERAGGLWEVLARTPRGVAIGLCRCDGGEEVDRFTSSDARVLEHIAGRFRSDE